MNQLLIGNDNVIWLDDPALTDSVSEETVEDATITFALVHQASGQTVASGSLTHVAGGVYRGEIPATTTLVENHVYRLTVTGASSGRDGQWNPEYVAKRRGAT